MYSSHGNQSIIGKLRVLVLNRFIIVTRSIISHAHPVRLNPNISPEINGKINGRYGKNVVRKRVE